ncbi:MAG: hypothetical protein QOF98_2027 [Streptomyces sp.]|jgi:hypothetical protein|nr:hypothetical protein [Streptomyces sp.]
MLALSFGAYVVEQLVQWRYGSAGMIAAGFIVFGFKARNTTCTAIGFTALALLLAQ